MNGDHDLVTLEEGEQKPIDQTGPLILALAGFLAALVVVAWGVMAVLGAL